MYLNMMPFSTEKVSLGRPKIFQDLIFSLSISFVRTFILVMLITL